MHGSQFWIHSLCLRSGRDYDPVTDLATITTNIGAAEYPCDIFHRAGKYGLRILSQLARSKPEIAQLFFRSERRVRPLWVRRNCSSS